MWKERFESGLEGSGCGCGSGEVEEREGFPDKDYTKRPEALISSTLVAGSTGLIVFRFAYGKCARYIWIIRVTPYCRGPWPVGREFRFGKQERNSKGF